MGRLWVLAYNGDVAYRSEENNSWGVVLFLMNITYNILKINAKFD